MAGSRTIALALTLVAFATAGVGAQVQNTAALHQAIAQAGGRAIVVLRSSRGAALRAPGSPPIASDEMNAIQGRLESASAVRVLTQIPLVGALVATMSDDDLARVAADSNVASIEPDVTTRLLSEVAPTGARPARIRADAIPWGVTDVGAPAAWAAGITGAGVKVGIIDTGIDIAHPDLVVVGGYDFTSNSSSPAAYDDTYSSCDGHGTHVAGTVAARQNGIGVEGVAPNASLYSLKVFADLGAGCLAYLSSQILAIQWATTNSLDVVNISIGNGNSPAFDTAIAAANAAGVVVVAAAGNSGAPGITYPAATPGAIAVAALNSDNTVAGFSSSGPEMWLAAPGNGITSTIPGGGYGDKSGTSMAAPHVTGVVALLRQMHPTWSADQIRTELKNDAADLAPTGFDNASGWGLVHVPAVGGGSITISAAPGARSISVPQGSTASGDNSVVTLSGTNASTTVWTATKRQSWLTFTNASGTGSGTVTWNRNATGLAVGTYVDTITISAAGAASPALVYDTLKITAVVAPVTLAVSPAARSISVPQGSTASGDNATVTLTGTNAASTAWSATNKQAWLSFTNSSGTGSGVVTWNRNATGLAVGTYVDTITVSAAGVTGSPARVYDTLKITAVVVPVTLAVSPAARSLTVQQGGAASGDNATVTLTGTNAASTAWSATKRQAWLSFTNSSGTGSGVVTWNRNATGLAVGTYVDTITVSATGVTGSPATVYDTLKISAAPVPVVLAVSPAARSISVQQGGTASGDNATVTLTGTNAASTAWSATKRQAWLSFTNSSGTGSGVVTWNRNATGLAVGTYVDTITVSATGVTGSPATVYDTLRITAAPVPVVMAVSPAARSVSVQQGGTAGGDNATVTLTGTNAASTAWTATKRQSWLNFTNASGTGSGTVSWNRNATGLAVGTYVDTITVSATGVTGSPATVYDTLRVTAAAAPLVLALSPAARSISVPVGGQGWGDNAVVTLTGSNATSATWSTTHTNSTWADFVNVTGTGSGVVTWNRNVNTLAVGVYVDTIAVTAPGAIGSPFVVFDTVRITAVAAPLTMAVGPTARSISVQQGTAATGDNATVTLTGTGASSTPWQASKKQPWLTLTNASGTGSGSVTWNRNSAGLAVGVYVDTITVTAVGATGSPGTVYDTLKITATPVAVALAVTPAARSTTVQQGSSATGDNANVILTGTNAAATGWSATRKSSWLVLTNASGTGTGFVTWNRNTAGLAAGTYVDTISVTAVGVAGPPATVFDTLRITALPVPVVIAVSPAARSTSVQQGNAAPGDNATVTLTGTNAASTAWSATKKQAWLNFTNSSGVGSGTVSWTRNAGGLAAGTYVDTITVTASGVTGSPATVYDTLRITAAPVPVVVAVSPVSRSVTAPQGGTASGDNAFVTLTGTNASTTQWSATHHQAWLSFTNAGGVGNGFVTWNRNASGLAVGTYVDTITVTAAGSAAIVIDSLRITAVAPTIALAPRGRKVRTVQFAGSARLSLPDADSAMVEATVPDSIAAGGWTATVTARLQLVAPSGAANSWVRWSRPAQTLDAGMYVDTVVVAMTLDATVHATFIDSLEVVAVSLPAPDVAVGDLFDHTSLTSDQRVALDRQGNNNGVYDLGDFLAWVTRSGIRLSPSASLKVQQAGLLPSAAVPAKPTPGGP